MGSPALGIPRGHAIRHNGPVIALAFSPDSTILYTGGKDGMVGTWDASTGLEARRAWSLGAPIVALRLSLDGKTMAVAARDLLIVRDAVSGLEKLRQRTHDVLTSIAMSPDGLWVAAGCYDHHARIWDLHRGSLHATTDKGHHVGPISAVEFSADGKVLASCSYDTFNPPLARARPGANRPEYGAARRRHDDRVQS